jgi:colanic acid biosynthesis glycosyl transferase WcaI
LRILILSQYYDPEPIPKPADLALALKARGDEVTVLTGFPNYPSGNLFPGFRLGLVRREVRDGVPIVRTYEFPYHGTSILGRFANYVSFMLSAPLGSLFVPKVDAIYVWHPPLTIGVSAWLIARARGIPVLYDVQDLWPESVVLSGVMKPGPVVDILSALERFVYRQMDHLIVVTEGAKKNVVSKGIPPDKVTAMPHWIDSTPFKPQSTEDRAALRAALGWSESFVLLFAGNLGVVQGLDTLVRAAALLRGDPGIRVVFIGDGADKPRLQGLVRALGLDAVVQFLDRQPSAKIPEFMSAADGLVVHLKASPLSEMIIPAKTLSYMASGTPTIMAMEGAAARLVEEAGAGKAVRPGDPEALAEAIRKFAALSVDEREAMGRRGREYVASNLTKEAVIPRYRALLERLVGAARS